MMLSPLTLFWLLVAGATVLAVLATFYPRLLRETAVGDIISVAAGGLGLLVWLAMRWQLPLTVTLSRWPDTALLPPWNWRMDETAWQLTGVVLLLTLAALLAASGRWQVASYKLQVASDELQVASSELRVASSELPVTESGRDQVEVTWKLPPPILQLLLAASTLATLWADSLAGVMVGWMLLAIVWVSTLLLAGSFRVEVTHWLGRASWLLLSIFVLWMGAAGVPMAAPLAMGTSPAMAITAVLVAVILQMGIWPLDGWRPFPGRFLPPEVAALVHTMPTVAGAALLVRLATGGALGMGYTLFLTAFGLLAILRGIRLAWAHLQEPTGLAAALALVQTSVILLTGVWAGPAAVVAEVRVLVLAVGVLFLLDGRPIIRAGWRQPVAHRVAGPMVALAALAGLPLTAGFAGRALLYNAWLANDRFMLVLVAALLHVPLITAILLSLGLRAKTDESLPDRGKEVTGVPVVREAGLLLPALGVLSLSGLGQASLVSWLAIVAAAVAGFVLPRFMGEVREARAALRQAFTVSLPLDAVTTVLKQWAQALKTAVSEAMLILEGEGGLLWLLVLAVVFLLAL